MATETQGTTEITVVGQGAKLEGTLVSAGSLRIDGSVKGKVNAEGDVILSPQSQVEADIRAVNVTVAGRFRGNIMAKQGAEVAQGGRVDGNITAKSLVVAAGAVFNGQSIMDQPAPEAAGRTEGSAERREPEPSPAPAGAGKRS